MENRLKAEAQGKGKYSIDGSAGGVHVKCTVDPDWKIVGFLIVERVQLFDSSAPICDSTFFQDGE